MLTNCPMKQLVTWAGLSSIHLFIEHINAIAIVQTLRQSPSNSAKKLFNTHQILPADRHGESGYDRPSEPAARAHAAAQGRHLWYDDRDVVLVR
jgi:hypothetical protein